MAFAEVNKSNSFGRWQSDFKIDLEATIGKYYLKTAAPEIFGKTSTISLKIDSAMVVIIRIFQTF